VRHRPHPTARAADQRGVGLHDKLQLTVDLVDLQQPHARQSEHGDADFVTLYTHLGPLCSQPWKSREYREVSGVSQRGHPTRPPRFIVKSPLRLGSKLTHLSVLVGCVDSPLPSAVLSETSIPSLSTRSAIMDAALPVALLEPCTRGTSLGKLIPSVHRTNGSPCIAVVGGESHERTC